MQARSLGAVVLVVLALAAVHPDAVARETPRPGTLVSARPMDAPDGARAWRVRYHSRALDGNDVVVSGVIVAPTARAPRGGRPVASWAHGTTGLADVCAPSRSPTVIGGLPWLRPLLDRGMVVAATDYEGLGTPGPHPYLVGESEGRGVLDIARAARRLRATRANGEVIAIGYSQGGHAALFAGELAADYAPDLDVRGVAAFAPVTDVTTLFAPTVATDVRGFVPMVAEGIRAAFPDADVDAVLAPETAAALARFDGSACLSATLAGFADPAVPVLRTDPTSVPSIAAALRRSTPGNVAASVPIAVFQGSGDTIVPARATAAYVARACALGDRVLARVDEGIDHGGVLSSSTDALLSWLDDRLAGDQAPSTC